MTTQSTDSVVILGAGLTGLAAAYFLTQRGYRPIVLDCPSWQDGFRLNPCDAAPVLFGCYRDTRRVLSRIKGCKPSQLGVALPLEFAMPDGDVVTYQSAHLPGALQWMMSLFSFHGLAWQDRWTLFSQLEQIWEQAKTLPPDLESRIADEWLASIGQSPDARGHIWAPLAQWLTGNSTSCLSAGMFVRLLSTIFLGQAIDARLTHLGGTIEDQFLVPIRSALHQCGAQFRSDPLQPDLRFGPDGISEVRLQDGSVIRARWYISALSHKKLLPLIPERLLSRYAYFAHLNDLEMLPELGVRFTVYLEAPSPRLMLLAGRSFQQLTIAALGEREMSCQLSGTDTHALMELDQDQLLDLGRSELRVLIPGIAQDARLSGEIIRDDQAALSLKPGTAVYRPIHQSPIRNLLVAGAWTDTGWPANVESAVVSAKRCAEIVASGQT